MFFSILTSSVSSGSVSFTLALRFPDFCLCSIFSNVFSIASIFLCSRDCNTMSQQILITAHIKLTLNNMALLNESCRAIVQYYLPIDKTEHTLPYPSHAGTQLTYLGEIDGRLKWFTCPQSPTQVLTGCAWLGAKFAICCHEYDTLTIILPTTTITNRCRIVKQNQDTPRERKLDVTSYQKHYINISFYNIPYDIRHNN